MLNLKNSSVVTSASTVLFCHESTNLLQEEHDVQMGEDDQADPSGEAAADSPAENQADDFADNRAAPVSSNSDGSDSDDSMDDSVINEFLMGLQGEVDEPMQRAHIAAGPAFPGPDSNVRQEQNMLEGYHPVQRPAGDSDDSDGMVSPRLHSMPASQLAALRLDAAIVHNPQPVEDRSNAAFGASAGAESPRRWSLLARHSNGSRASPSAGGVRKGVFSRLRKVLLPLHDVVPAALAGGNCLY